MLTQNHTHMLAPSSLDELKELVTKHPKVLAVGGRTKSRLSAVDDSYQIISTQNLSGITEYNPAEYTFTALAGTRIKDIHAALKAKGQFLPCSALMRDSGATLGGAVASGLSGPGRFRFGGLRDFLLGVRYLDSHGQQITAGGKVVKNAAGFDIPKFMVGSLGRFGILTELTFKVFPRPSSLTTVRIQCANHQQASERIMRAAAARWELYAIDYLASEQALYLRLGGPTHAVAPITEDILTEWQGEATALTAEENDAFWHNIRELHWISPEGHMVKVPITPKIIPTLQSKLNELKGIEVHYSVAGNVAGISVPDSTTLPRVDHILCELNLSGMNIIGTADTPLWLGLQPLRQISQALKQALDPLAKFPAL